MRRLNAEFITYLAVSDFGPFFEKLMAQGVVPKKMFDILLIFKDIGFYNEQGKAKPVLVTWDKWLKKPYKEI